MPQWYGVQQSESSVQGPDSFTHVAWLPPVLIVPPVLVQTLGRGYEELLSLKAGWEAASAAANSGRRSDQS